LKPLPAPGTPAARLLAWQKSNGLIPARGSVCAFRLWGKYCPSHRGRYDLAPVAAPCRPPGCDHVSLWRGALGRLVFVSQPYNLDQRTIQEMIEWGRPLKLQFHITAWQSWHYPGHTLLVAWTRDECEPPHGGGDEIEGDD
jgi:hypothetical protein